MGDSWPCASRVHFISIRLSSRGQPAGFFSFGIKLCYALLNPSLVAKFSNACMAKATLAAGVLSS